MFSLHFCSFKMNSCTNTFSDFPGGNYLSVMITQMKSDFFVFWGIVDELEKGFPIDFLLMLNE